MSLEIECHGYGPKPEWIDGGPKEKEKAVEVKRAVRQGISQRSRCQMPINRFTLDKEFTPPSPVTKPKQKVTGSESINAFWDSSLCDHMAEPDVRPPTSLDPLDTQAQSPSDIVLIESTFMQYDQHLNVCDDQVDSSSLPPSDKCSSIASTKAAYSMTAKETDLVGIYFDTIFYKLFPFYNLKKGIIERRGWLLALIIAKGPAQQACLGLTLECLAHMTAKSSEYEALKEIQTNLEAKYYYSRAVESLSFEIAHWIRKDDKSCLWKRREKTIEILFSILQLIIFELCQDGDSTQWKTHFEGGSNIITGLAPWDTISPLSSRSSPMSSPSHRIASTSNSNDASFHNNSRSSPASSTHTSCSQCSCVAPHDISSMVISSKFVYLFFICLDIVDAASTRTPLRLPIDHVQLLCISQQERNSNKSEIYCAKLFGVEDWTFLMLCKIIKLETLKETLSTTGQLSMARLGEQGAAIEAEIQQNLVISHTLPQEQQHHPPSSQSYELCTLISEIFAHSTLIYLHVMLSGLLPLLPEIRSSLSAAISLLKVLSPEHRSLWILRWPLAVLFCLAREDERTWLDGCVANNWATKVAQECKNSSDWAHLQIFDGQLF